MFNRSPKPVYLPRHLRGGDIGEKQHEIEMEPLTAPSVPEPVVEPQPIVEPEPVPA